MALDLIAHLDRVRSVTVRDVAGAGAQAELQIQTRRGSISIRLISDTPIRVVDLRARDKAKRARSSRRGVLRHDVPLEAPRS